MKVYKQQLLDTVVEKLNGEYNKKVVRDVVETFIETIREVLFRGDFVSLAKLGTFKTKQRKERNMVNPITRQPMVVPEKVVPIFRAAKSLKELVK